MLVTFSTQDGKSEPLELSETLDVSEVRGFVEAMLGIASEEQVWRIDGRVVSGTGSLAENGIKDQDLVMVMKNSSSMSATAPPRTLSVASSPPPNAPQRVVSPRAGAGLSRSEAVYWEGMSVDQVMQHNSNPEHIVDILQANEVLLREMNFHNPKLANHLRQDRATALRELRTFLMMNATNATISKIAAAKKESDMERRLAINPMDEEANKFFGEKIREEQVQESYMNMMTNYPESMTRVLMLYIEVKINGVPLQAFVDTGAQTSVISGRCAERCNISRLVDSRFAGQVVGVGTGRTLGRVHVVDIKIGDNFFPISLTVMDDSEGLGDKNMEFLLGLDMLKRHRATVDLVGGQLLFHGSSGAASTPFLHEKDLPESKGGTKDYNPNAVGGTEEESQAKE